MAFQFAYALNGDGTGVVKDFPLDTVANYGNGGAKKGDLVINSSGLLRRAGITSTVASVVGVLEGQEFLGLVAKGPPYAATNSSFTADAVDTSKNPNGVGKVRFDKTASVYKVPVAQSGAKQTATNADINGQFAIAIVNGDQQVDLNNTAGSTLLVKVIDFTTDGKYVFVTLV